MRTSGAAIVSEATQRENAQVNVDFEQGLEVMADPNSLSQAVSKVVETRFDMPETQAR